MTGEPTTRSPATPLRTPLKRTFSFSLACPSFIYRAGYTENVRLLAPFVDEVELLFFESRFQDSLPSPALVAELEALGREGDIAYNVHLPTDIFPGHREAAERSRAVTVLREMVRRCMPLAPTTFTLHLNRDPSEPDDRRWQEHCITAVETVLADGLPARRISVENLDYDFTRAAPVVEALDLSVCMDMGHLMVRDESPAAFHGRWRERIAIVHLHGVDGDRDHLPLDRLAPDRLRAALALLHGFRGTLSLEVFSREALDASLARMAEAVC
jgi:sugar phosphate isomerase/epimerase